MSPAGSVPSPVAAGVTVTFAVEVTELRPGGSAAVAGVRADVWQASHPSDARP